MVGGVVSGRWASRGGGALQIPKLLRAAVLADPGWTLVVADAAQLEPRILAALAGDRVFAQAATTGDLYEAVATAIGADRATAKVALLSAMYGGTGADGGQSLALFRRRFPQASAFVESAARAGEEGRVVKSVLGRTCPPSSAWLATTAEAADPEQERDPGAGAAARARGRFTRNFVVQASAADWAVVFLAGLRRRLSVLNLPYAAGPSPAADEAARSAAGQLPVAAMVSRAWAAEVVRAALLRMRYGFAKGTRGVRPENRRAVARDAQLRCAVPPVRMLGSVGQADLAPLADLAHGAIGDLAPIGKETLSLVDQNSFSTALTALAFADATRLMDAFDVAGAFDLEGFGGNLTPLHPAVAGVRPHPGPAATIARLTRLLDGSPLWDEEVALEPAGPLSFRCLAQVHGAARDALDQAGRQLAIELNASQESPPGHLRRGPDRLGGELRRRAAGRGDRLPAHRHCTRADKRRRTDGEAALTAVLGPPHGTEDAQRPLRRRAVGVRYGVGGDHLRGPAAGGTRVVRACELQPGRGHRRPDDDGAPRRAPAEMVSLGDRVCAIGLGGRLPGARAARPRRRRRREHARSAGACVVSFPSRARASRRCSISSPWWRWCGRGRSGRCTHSRCSAGANPSRPCSRLRRSSPRPDAARAGRPAHRTQVAPRRAPRPPAARHLRPRRPRRRWPRHPGPRTS